MVDGCPVVRHATFTIVDLAGTDRKPPTNTLNSPSSSLSPSRSPGPSSGPSPYTFAINLSLSKLRKVANELALAQSLGYGNSNNNDNNDDDENDDNSSNNDDEEEEEEEEEEEDGYGQIALDSDGDDDDDDDDDDNHRHRRPNGRSRPTSGRTNTRSSASARASASVVSYKESVLTFLLKDALAGDSRTLVITTLSPLDTHRECSVSTMAFAGVFVCF